MKTILSEMWEIDNEKEHLNLDLLSTLNENIHFFLPHKCISFLLHNTIRQRSIQIRMRTKHKVTTVINVILFEVSASFNLFASSV